MTTRTLQEWQALVKAGKVYVKLWNQREQQIRVKVQKITSIDEETGHVMCWTNLSPVSAEPEKLEVK